MSDRKARRKSQKIMECKHCGHQQKPDVSFCENCGYDMGLYGKILWVDVPDDSSNQNDKKPSRWLAAAAVLVAAVVLFNVLKGLGSDDKVTETHPAETAAEATDAATVPEETEAFAVPMTLPEEQILPEIGDEAVLQDFEAFANGYATLMGEEVIPEEKRCSLSYRADKAIMKPIFQEYKQLVESEFPYQFMDTAIAIENFEMTYYWYSYTGPDDVAEVTMGTRTDKKIENCNIWMVYCEYPDRANADIHVGVADGVAYKDCGYRTSFVQGAPAEITGLYLDVYDLLNDVHGDGQVDWMPQGFQAGYKVDVEYKGQQTGTFLGNVTSSDESVLKVDQQNACLEAVAPGKAVITAEMDGFRASQEIYVYPVTDTGATLTVTPAVIEVSGNQKVEVKLNLTMGFGENGVQSLKILANDAVVAHSKLGNWVKTGHMTYENELGITIDPQLLQDHSDLGLLLCVVKKDETGSKYIGTNMVAFTEVPIVRKGN